MMRKLMVPRISFCRNTRGWVFDVNRTSTQLLVWYGPGFFCITWKAR